MSALSQLLEAGAGLEVVHQLVLKILLREPAVASALRLASDVEAVDWEPSGGIFDLAVQPRRGETKWIELKVDSIPNADQFERQRQHATRLGGTTAYFLIGLGDIEMNEAKLRAQAGENALRVSTASLLAAVRSALPQLTGDAKELAEAYVANLDRLLIARAGPLPPNLQDWGRREHYYCYERVQRLLGFGTSIYSRKPRGRGMDFIMNVDDPAVGGHCGGDAGVPLYFEVVQGIPKFKLSWKRIENLESRTAPIQQDLRDQVRTLLRMNMSEVPLVKAGRLGGNSFTVMSVNQDLRTMPASDAAALMTLLYERFRPVHQSLCWDGERGKFKQTPSAPTA